MQQLIVLKFILVARIINPSNLNTGIIVDFLLHLTAMGYNSYSTIVAAWYRLDHLMHDITPLEEATLDTSTEHLFGFVGQRTVQSYVHWFPR